MSRLLDDVTCARCVAKLDLSAARIACASCGQKYPRVGRIPVLLPQPDAHLELWRRQLALLQRRSEHTLRALREQGSLAGLPGGALARLHALAQGVRDQTRELFALLAPALGGVLPTGELSLPPGADNPLGHLHYLYRDWGWGVAGEDESATSFEAVRKVIAAAPLGRMLVLGAGGSRLAYDLHRSCGATATALLDIDPFVFVIAEAVVRGASVTLTESSANVNQAERVALPWSLHAPAGALSETDFLFVFGNGLAPPFAAQTFDTVVTPWFIDQVPPDLPAFLRTLKGLLRPDGRWINHGPLIYPADAPLARRHSREEVFALVEQAGFRVQRWSAESRPYLVSPLNGRGKLEWVLTFEAVKRHE